MRRFWEQEKEPASPVPLTPDEQRCEDIFVRTHKRTPSGRFVVRLPFASLSEDLPDIRKSAERLLTAMERKGSQDPRFGELYRTFMREYEQLHHMEPIEPNPAKGARSLYYLPHHGVLRESSASTKLRVVFNGSQRTRSGESLNNHLLIGANLLPSLFDTSHSSALALAPLRDGHGY